MFFYFSHFFHAENPKSSSFFFKTGHRGSALFSQFSGQHSPYMHPSAELYIPVSDVHPSLAMQITLFSLLRGLKNLKRQKKNKMTEPMSQYPKPRKTKKKQKKNDRTHVPVSKTSKNQKKTKKNKKAEPMSQYLAWGQYFCFFCFWR